MKFNIDACEFAERLADLRIQKGVSARDMSLSLGQCSGYINKIEHKISLPSMLAFFEICEYLDITPMDFFNFDDKLPLISYKIIEEIQLLDTNQTTHIYNILKDINGTA